MRMGSCAAALYAGGRRAGEAARWSDRDRAGRRHAAARRCGVDEEALKRVLRVLGQ